MQPINIDQAKANQNTLSTFAEAGWGISHFKLSSEQGNGGPTVYLCDIEHQQLYVVASAPNALDVVRALQKKQGISFQHCHETLSTFLLKRSTQKHEKDEAFLNQFVLFTLMYAFQTKSFEHVKNTANPAIIVLHYIDRSDDTPLLRPNPLPDSTAMFSPDAIKQIANRILDQDKKNHPTRFTRAKLIRFTAKKTRALKLGEHSD